MKRLSHRAETVLITFVACVLGGFGPMLVAPHMAPGVDLPAWFFWLPSSYLMALTLIWAGLDWLIERSSKGGE